MRKLDFTKPLQAAMMYCPLCQKHVDVGVAYQMFVYHCDWCNRLYEYADCRQCTVTLQPNPPEKGDHRYEEDPATGDHP